MSDPGDSPPAEPDYNALRTIRDDIVAAYRIPKPILGSDLSKYQQGLIAVTGPLTGMTRAAQQAGKSSMSFSNTLQTLYLEVDWARSAPGPNKPVFYRSLDYLYSSGWSWAGVGFRPVEAEPRSLMSADWPLAYPLVEQLLRDPNHIYDAHFHLQATGDPYLGPEQNAKVPGGDFPDTITAQISGEFSLRRGLRTWTMKSSSFIDGVWRAALQHNSDNTGPSLETVAWGLTDSGLPVRPGEQFVDIASNPDVGYTAVDVLGHFPPLYPAGDGLPYYLICFEKGQRPSDPSAVFRDDDLAPLWWLLYISHSFLVLQRVERKLRIRSGDLTTEMPVFTFLPVAHYHKADFGAKGQAPLTRTELLAVKLSQAYAADDLVLKTEVGDEVWNAIWT